MSPRRIERHRAHRHPRKDLSDEQEFHLMTLVLDKFLWLGTILIGVGIYFMIRSEDVFEGVPYIGAGIGIIIVFGITIVRYFEHYSS